MGSREQGSTGRQPDLAERVAAIKPGDTVTARFTHGLDEYTVSGVARDDEGWLRVGGTVLRRNDTPVEYLVAIESHEPAKPSVPPEPTGDVLVAHPFQVFRRSADGWLSMQGTGPFAWFDVVYFDPEHPEWPTVYRPEPSPERIEELIHEYASTDKWHEVLAQFAADLLGGEQS